MDATKIRKALEYIDELISILERDSSVGMIEASDARAARDARKGYNYIKFILDQIPEKMNDIEDKLDSAKCAINSASESFDDIDEPADSHLL